MRLLGDELLARQYVRRLGETSDRHEAEALMRQAADLGEPGLRVLVAGLGSSRESVARAAKDVIAERLEAWKSLRTRYSTPLLARLAHELAAAADGFDADARKDAARFARQILERRLDRHAVNRLRVVWDCQIVMRSARPDAKPPHRIADDRPGSRLHAGSDAGSLPITRLAALAGGGLPKSVDPIPQEETLEEQMERIAGRSAIGDPQARDTDQDEQNEAARWFNAPTAPRPVIDGRDAPGLFRPAHVAARLSSNAADVADGKQDSASLDKGSDASRSELSRAKTADLLRHLKSGDGPTAAAAKNELQCRGFKDHHFRIAERLFDPDPAVRMAMARRLPGIPRLNPQPWLLVLAGDTDSDVRLTAITLLATAADPAVLAEVESLARRDGDSRIQLQAKRIADSRARR